MCKMVYCFYLQTILTAIFIFKGTRGDAAIFINKTLTYTDAENFCKSKYNGQIWNGSHDSSNILACVKGETVWTNRTNEISPWISVKGCFRRNNSDAQREVIFSYHEHWTRMVFECQSSCGSDEYYAVYASISNKNTTCFCINSESGLDRNWVKTVNDLKCNNHWTGGRSNFSKTIWYTMYKRVSVDDKHIEDNSHQCLYKYCTQEKKVQITSVGCSANRHTLCSTKQLTIRGTWHDGVENCWKTYKSFPLEFSEVNINGGCRSDMKGFIGVFRAGCQTMDSQEKPAKSMCSERYPFVCISKDITGVCRQDHELEYATDGTSAHMGQVSSAASSVSNRDVTMVIPTSSTVNEKSTQDVGKPLQEDGEPPPEDGNKILIGVLSAVFVLVAAVTGIFVGYTYKRRHRKVTSTLPRTEDNEYVDEGNLGNRNLEKGDYVSNYDVISDGDLNQGKTYKPSEETDDSLNHEAGYDKLHCDTHVKSSRKSDDYDTTNGNEYDVFEANKKNHVIDDDYNTVKDITMADEYDILIKRKAVNSDLGNYNTVEELNMDGQ